ncbi:hypothetical protein [Marinobacter sp. ELB17]|uniref:hypothetical protein n=1 Tax=Marinobacter sp. ELB17 TaxID=270374 RepID=UPI0000F39A6A|nr:hypothetical protein [Marinobacter sp. ELB17]EAZ99848.1 hypothetical protein MELB17_12611 [Marinobacter sp. ELB17]
MSVIYYGPGKHPAGFVGFIVTRTPIEGFKPECFSTSHIREQLDHDVRFKYLRLKAEYLDTAWEAEILILQYRRFVSSNDPSTGSDCGVGVHGITTSFVLDRQKKWQACFLVSASTSGTHRREQREFTFRNLLFSQVWYQAVEFWAREHEILRDDTVRVLASPPAPEQFKRLRRNLNDQKGTDIPIEALSPVFEEQRALLAHQRREKGKAARSPAPTQGTDTDPLQSEMAAWFQHQLHKAQP